MWIGTCVTLRRPTKQACICVAGKYHSCVCQRLMEEVKKPTGDGPRAGGKGMAGRKKEKKSLIAFQLEPLVYNIRHSHPCSNRDSNESYRICWSRTCILDSVETIFRVIDGEFFIDTTTACIVEYYTFLKHSCNYYTLTSSPRIIWILHKFVAM